METHKKRDTVTIKDIAKKLNIAPSSVSRALNNNKRISEKTRSLVWETAREMGYQPNVSGYLSEAQSLKNIGVIVPDLSHCVYIDH